MYHVRLMYDFYSRTMYFVFELLRKSFVHRTFVLRTSGLMYEGQIYDVEHMSIEETKQLREKLLKERDEAIAKLNLILARDPNLNPVRLEDFPYYATVKKIQKGV